MESIKEVLMRRDNMSEENAENLIKEAKEELQYYIDNDYLEDAYNICEEYFGLEPDYLMELI